MFDKEAHAKNKTTKKILYFHSVSGGGGCLQSLLYLINEVDKEKYNYKILCPGYGESYDVFRRYGVDVDIETDIKTFGHTTGGWYSFTKTRKCIRDFYYIFYSAWKMRKIIIEEKPDIVHIGSSTLLGPALGARLANVPIVWHVREYIHNGYLGMRKWILSTVITRFSRAIIVVTKSDAKRLKPSPKIHVIYDSVDFSEFNQDIDGKIFKKEFNIDDNVKTVGMFGGISRIKGTLEFVKAAEKLLQSNKNYQFYIFGDSIYGGKNKIKKFIKKSILKNDYLSKVLALINQYQANIINVGTRRDIPQIMAGLDLIVFPSIVPHAALPVIEAGAMAKPVVASRWGETEEEIDHNVTGVLVEPKNTEALSKTINALLSDTELANTMGAKGHLKTKKLFDIKKNIIKIENVYEKILI